MAANLISLAHNVPITDPNTGFPTPAFTRLLQRLGVGSSFTVDSNGNIQFASFSPKTILANLQAVSATPTQASLTQVLDLVGSAAQGDILYRNATGWVRLPAGTSGNLLQTNGTGANPTWVTPPSGGGGGAFGEFAYSPPLASALTLVNGGAGATSTKTDHTGKGLGIKLTAVAGGRSVAAIQTPPAAPYTLTARVTAFGGMTTGLNAEMLSGIILRNSSNGRAMVAFRYQDRNIYTQTFTDMNAGGSNTVTGPSDAYFYPNSALYFAVHVTAGGSVQFYYSGNGAQWEPLGAATTLATFLTASGGSVDQIGLYLGAQAATTRTAYMLCPYYRVDAVTPPALAL